MKFETKARIWHNKKGEIVMPVRNSIFSDGSNVNERYVRSYKDLKKLVEAMRALGLKIVLTQGTFDMIHVGHSRYFETAKRHGDVLIVGVDSDEKVRARKGPDRPVVPEGERIEMLCHQRHVDVVTLKELNAKRWELIKLVRPDVLIATKETYKEKELRELKKICGQVVVLEPQATTSTSAKIRLLHTSNLQRFKAILFRHIEEAMKEALGGKKK